MKVEKVLNNSLVLSRDESGQEIIVMGKGLGFNSKEGDHIQESSVEKIFTPNDQRTKQEYVHLLESIPREYLDTINSALEEMKSHWRNELDDRYFLMLLDHIAFAIERVEKGVILQNKLLNEVRIHYPEEYTAGMIIITHLNKHLHINLPEEEAGNIAFHLVNAKNEEENFENTVLAVTILKDILNIVRYQLNVKLDHQSMRYNRFVTHLQYFIRRVFDNKQLNSKDSFLYEHHKAKYPDEFKCSQSIAIYCESMTGKYITNEEVFYLIIHLVRFTTNET
ncbi:MAG: transcription antiterminator [Neobacillus sp.]|nr:transcription antiterminator [Neobacillus sp.]